MRYRTPIVLLELFLFFHVIAAAVSLPEVRRCSCSPAALCEPLGEAVQLYPQEPHVATFLEKKDQPELFAFMHQCNASTYEKFDWARLTTISLLNFFDEELLCHAHSHGVKVVGFADYPKAQLTNATARQEFVASKTEYLLAHGMDGINMDFEQPLDEGSPEVDGYSALISELAEAVHSAISDSQVSVDGAIWINSDWRHYDWAAIMSAADLLFIMAYDEQDQVCDGPCTAKANSPLEKTRSGVQSYLNLGIPGSKMALGMPWYGYHYSCIEYHEDGTCRFDEPGHQDKFEDIVKLLEESGTTPAWDSSSMSPYASIQSSDGSWEQLRYDGPVSLGYKTQMAAEEGLKGTGIWTANNLDYGDSPEAEAMRALMWGAMVKQAN